MKYATIPAAAAEIWKNLHLDPSTLIKRTGRRSMGYNLEATAAKKEKPASTRLFVMKNSTVKSIKDTTNISFVPIISAVNVT